MASKYAVKERVSAYRARMRARGMRQVNLWVPDTQAPGFAKECRRQSLLVAKSDRKDSLMDELERAAAEIEGWTA